MQELFGSRTKISIISACIRDPEPRTRNRIAKEIGGGVGPVYSSIEDLIVLGILRREGKRIELNDPFPYLDMIKALFLTMDGHYRDTSLLLSRIDELFGDAYYISGYISAAARGIPVDHVQSTILLFVKGDEKLRAGADLLLSVSGLHGTVLPTDTIPPDIERMGILGADVWAAPLERALSEGCEAGEFGLYPCALMIVQHMMENDIDLMKLEAVSNRGKASRLLRAIRTLRPDLVPKKLAVKQTLDPDYLRSARDAINTVVGGS
jgi:hypothetical protein